MISAMRDHVFSLACVRHGVPAREGRGMDQLPPDVARPLEDALVRRIDAAEMSRAFRVVTRSLLEEARLVDESLAHRLEAALLEMSGDESMKP